MANQQAVQQHQAFLSHSHPSSPMPSVLQNPHSPGIIPGPPPHILMGDGRNYAPHSRAPPVFPHSQHGHSMDHYPSGPRDYQGPPPPSMQSHPHHLSALPPMPPQQGPYGYHMPSGPPPMSHPDQGSPYGHPPTHQGGAPYGYGFYDQPPSMHDRERDGGH